MTYSPNIFSTKAGLTRNIVSGWVMEKDINTIQRWLTEGEKHPRLAEEAIVAALTKGDIDTAEIIWQAQWHSPGKTFLSMWDVPNHMHYNAQRLEDPSHLARMRRGNPSYPDASQTMSLRANVIDWVLSKSHADATSTPFKARNAGLIRGLITAFDNDDEQLWDKIMKMGPKLDVSEGNELLSHMLMRMEVMPNPFSHDRRPKAQWVQDKALTEVFNHGVRPGGSLWVAAASSEDSRPLLDLMISRASKLTVSRQRTAILILAADQKSIYFDRLLDTFLPLGFPESISLTASEEKKGEEYFETLYLRDRHSDGSFLKFKNPYEEKELRKTPASISAVLGQQRWSDIVRTHLNDVAQASTPEIKASSPLPKI